MDSTSTVIWALCVIIVGFLIYRVILKVKRPKPILTFPQKYARWIKATDEKGKEYLFGTNDAMLEKDVERFSQCDLSRYPVGEIKGFNNKIEIIYSSTQETSPGNLNDPYWNPSKGGSDPYEK